jgi:hypothetical protein
VGDSFLMQTTSDTISLVGIQGDIFAPTINAFQISMKHCCFSNMAARITYPYIDNQVNWYWNVTDCNFDKSSFNFNSANPYGPPVYFARNNLLNYIGTPITTNMLSVNVFGTIDSNVISGGIGYTTNPLISLSSRGGPLNFQNNTVYNNTAATIITTTDGNGVNLYGIIFPPKIFLTTFNRTCVQV